MHFEVLHNQIMSQATSFVKVLLMIVEMIGVVLDNSVNFETPKIHWDEEENGKTGGSVNVLSNVLIVECNVNPGTSSRKPRSH